MKISSWERFIDALIVRKVSFTATFFLVFLITYSVLAWVDFLPEPVEEQTEKNEEINNTSSSTATAKQTETENESDSLATDEQVEGENDEKSVAGSESEDTVSETAVFPESIIFDTLDRSVPVSNPNSRLVSDLDMALLSGAVRHPDSATLSQKGTVFILAHSSYLPHVANSNFRAFNGIQDLEWGDMVRVSSKDKEYIYRVNRVYRAEASDVTVPIAVNKQRLVLATCNSFGSVDDRYIVEADLYKVVAIAAGSV